MKTNTRNIALSGILCALAYIVMLISKIIPEVSGFLQLDLKDVIIVSGGFIMGPWHAFIISAVVSFIEFLTVSSTGIIGMIMNIVSTAAFCCVAAGIYKANRSFKGAICGLGLAVISLTIIMLLWNYYITPLYMKVPREAIKAMLLPVFLPFNAVKGLINSSLTLILYRPLTDALSKTGFIKRNDGEGKKRLMALPLITGLIVLACCIPYFLHLLGIL
ncbi:MAG: ECF transporter S component [Clostridia bacterium]|nr:ECF transporter S component [Clostridia bacterium]